MRRSLIHPLIALLTAVSCPLLAGCVSGNPTYFPYLTGPGQIKQSHAKPPGRGYYANFDPHACRLEVRPMESTNPVRAHKVFMATVYDGEGRPLRNRRIEWMLEGVGNIIEVDESGHLPGRGYKVDNRYAVSYTNYHNHRMTRGNLNPNDDFELRPGQTWCVVSSAVEGDTQLTVYAPEIFNWENNKVVVSTRWVDAEWTLPQPVTVRAGQEVALATTIFRHTDRQPLTNYRVRYRILDGPPAVLLPTRVQEAVEISDLRGIAGVGIAQVAPQPGVNRVLVEIIRPPDPTAPSGVGIVIGHGETTVNWQAPSVGLTITGPPNVLMGQTVTYSTNVRNTGQVEIQGMTVENQVPDGLVYQSSQPPAIVQGNRLIWTLGMLPPGQAHALQTTYQATRAGAVSNCARVATFEGLRDEKCASTQVTTAQIGLNVTGPPTAILGQPFNLSITVNNPGSGPATNVLLKALLGTGLEHASRAPSVELALGTLAPGESKTTTLPLTGRQPGPLATRVTVTADGGLTQTADNQVTIQQPQLSLAVNGPPVRFVDQSVAWDVQVSNGGDVPLGNVVLRSQLPPEVTYESSSQGGQVVGGQIQWNLGALGPREQRTLQITGRCTRMTPKAINVLQVTAEPGGQSQAREAVVEIRGLPAFSLDVQDVGDPAEVGGRVLYKVNVTNNGSLPANGLSLTAVVPAQMKVVNANGPTTPTVQANTVVFPAVDGVGPKQALSYAIEVQALQVGDVRFEVSLVSATMREPLRQQESTTIYAPTQGGAAPGAGAAPGRAPTTQEPPPAVPPTTMPNPASGGMPTVPSTAPPPSVPPVVPPSTPPPLTPPR